MGDRGLHVDAAPGARPLIHRVVVPVLVAAALRGAGAQSLQPEARVDVHGPAPASLEPGVGITTPLGTYVRLGATAGYPVVGRDEARHLRADLVARVTLDPFRQERFGISIGGGVTVRGSRAYLAALLDIEGPALGRVVPAIQAGVSGGVRAGLVLRRAIPGRR